MEQPIHTAINWLPRSRIQELLEEAGFGVYDSESTDDLRETLRQSVEDGDIPEEVLSA